MTVLQPRPAGWLLCSFLLVVISVLQPTMCFAPTSPSHRPQSSCNKGSFGFPNQKPIDVSNRALFATPGKEDTGTPKRKKKHASAKKKKKKKTSEESPEQAKARKKQQVMKQIQAKLKEKKAQQGEKNDDGGSGNLLNRLNPFQAGQNLRQTLGRLTTIGGLSTETKQKYYLDDRFLDPAGGNGVLSERNPYLERMEGDSYIPEVLVIGATGEVGRLVVRRLLLEGRFRVRVLVRDLYSQTLNLLGTGVTYCQSDLSNMESLEYALTDVDKIVFCAGAPKPDEEDFQEKFQYYAQENLNHDSKEDSADDYSDESSDIAAKLQNETAPSDLEWERLSSVLEVRAQLAEQVDSLGMQNLITAYQNVRHADYGTSQAAKRSLFKFSGRPEDFKLFSVDGDAEMEATEGGEEGNGDREEDYSDGLDADYNYEADEDDYEDDYEDYYENIETRRDATVKTQVQWIRNEFGHGVFVGNIPKTDSSGVGGEAAIVSSRLRSREDPENGIDLSAGFAGFIVRLCADGGKYEAFIRTGAYEEKGIEYVCDFSTYTKPTSKGNKSRNKFTTARLPFELFQPVLRKEVEGVQAPAVLPFQGSDIRFIGFRYRSASNPKQGRRQEGENQSFYISLSYVKVYRRQPEPEFVYLSDARIPPVIHSGMVRHKQRMLLTSDAAIDTDAENVAVPILDEKTLQSVSTAGRSPEETYYKYRGEEILKNSGLSYTIVRVSGFNESPSGETSTIDLKSSDESPSAVSRDEAAQVCVSALMDPNALNKSVYMTKKKSSNFDEDISAKFSDLPTDSA